MNKTHLFRWADVQKPFRYKDGSAYSAHSLIRRNPPFKTDSAYNFSVAIHDATISEGVSDVPFFKLRTHSAYQKKRRTESPKKRAVSSPSSISFGIIKKGFVKPTKPFQSFPFSDFLSGGGPRRLQRGGGVCFCCRAGVQMSFYLIHR